MPGRVKSKDACDGEAPSKKPKAHPKKRGGRKMPPPLPTGQVLTDLAKGRWILGTSVGKGGFGEIYLASPEGSSVTQAAAKHVVKIVRFPQCRVGSLMMHPRRNLTKMDLFLQNCPFTIELQSRNPVSVVLCEWSNELTAHVVRECMGSS